MIIDHNDNNDLDYPTDGTFFEEEPDESERIEHCRDDPAFPVSSFSPGSTLEMLSRHLLLSPEEEKRLLFLYKEYGDLEAYQKLIRSNIRLIIKCAWRISRNWKAYNVSFDDLVSEGILGLIYSIINFDLNRNCKLSTYAYQWIEKRITTLIDKSHPVMQIPNDIGAFIRTNHHHISAWLIGKTDTIPHYILTRINELKDIVITPSPFYTDSLNEETDNIYAIKIIDPDSTPDVQPLDISINNELRRILSEDSLDILKRYIGIDPYPAPQKLEFIAAFYSVSVKDIFSKVNKSLEILKSNRSLIDLL